MSNDQETTEGIAEQDLPLLVSRLREEFPGLWCEQDEHGIDLEVNGADLVGWLTYQIHELRS